MADFQQQGSITTLHRLNRYGNDEALTYLSQRDVGNRVALILPCLISEVDGPALPLMVEELSELEWVGRVIVGVDGADDGSFEAAQTLFSQLPQATTVIWNDSNGMKEFDRRVGIAPGTGKGRNLWRSLGVANGFAHIDTVVVHDADISTYEASFVARLAHPIVDERLGFDFVKGFYPRFDEAGLNGRLTRLLVGPLLGSLISLAPDNADLKYLESFRYPLAGEFASRISVANSIAMPEHWGVDIALLTAARSLGAAVAQTDLTDRYDHKHQSLSVDDADSGLHRMARDVISTLLSVADLDEVDASTFDERLNHAVSAHRANAISNGIPVNEPDEAAAGALFSKLVRERQSPLPSDLPSWEQLRLEFPDCVQDLASVVESQNTSPGATRSSP
ncbi:MAG: hypothetical protein QF637_05405 [Acidimicrobiales bacterium]|nr:hypothetical protein [Acidimicrobiales bacterium]